MSDTEEQTIEQLDERIHRYQIALETLKTYLKTLPIEIVLEVLLARDAVEEILAKKTEVPPKNLLLIFKLDESLKQQIEAINKAIYLEALRTTFNPPASAWWWYLDSYRPPSKQLDWVWESLSVISLIITSSIIANLHPKFLVGGLGIAEALGIFSQSGLALLVAGGTLTSAGKGATERLLKLFKIPKYYEPEASFVLSLLGLVTAVGLNISVPAIAEHYYRSGLKHLYQGELSIAQDDFDQAIALIPNNSDYHLARGALSESLLELDDAKSQYKIALADKNYQAFNRLGRVAFLEDDYTTAETWFRLGLETVEDELSRYYLLRNLAWTLLKQKQYSEAEETLKQALMLSDTLPPDEQDGLIHCLYANLLMAQNREKTDTVTLKEQQQKCQDRKIRTGGKNWYSNTLERLEHIKDEQEQSP